MADLVRRPAGAVVVRPLARELVEEAAANARRSLSKASQRAYATSWARFEAWCVAHGLSALPADEPTIVTYLTAAAAGYALDGAPVAPLGYASLERLYAALRVRHEEAGHPLGTLRGVRNTMKSLGRALGVAPKQKKALTGAQVAAACKRLPETPAGVRDRAVLLFGWSIGQRRSDIADLRVGDVAFDDGGAIVTIRKSKTDQLGVGRTIGVTRTGRSTCPVNALEHWLLLKKASSDSDSLLGVSDVTVNAIVKRAAASLGLDPREYGGHSLRRGFVTTAARAGHDVSTIMRTTGHRSVAQVQTYIERATPFEGNVGSSLLAEVGEDVEEDSAPKIEVATIAASDGQPLVDRRAARRVVRAPDYVQNGAPCDVAWLRKAVSRLSEKGRSGKLILAALRAVGVRRGNGEELTDADVKRLLA